MDAYINFLKYVKEKYYEFNISVLKVIYSRLEIEEKKNKYTYVYFADLYNNFQKKDDIKKKYGKEYDSLSRFYNQSIKIYGKLIKVDDIKNKCKRDIEMFETKLKRLNYFLDSLKNIYNQLYSENYITTNEEGNPEIVENERIQKQEDINSNWKYRQYLTNNALHIMKYNNMEACYDLGIPSHIETNKTPSSNVPYLFQSNYDTGKPGFGYNNSDLKQPYLSREQLNSRMISPSINVQSFTKN